MANFTEHAVKYENGNKIISYIATGPKQGPLLIFLHGWPAIGKTWERQLTTFASLGFRAVAPDMPGYGKSTSNKVYSDYAQEKIVPGMLALLEDVGREEAIWIAHDWGCGVLSALAATHPQVCRGVCLMAVPYRTLELGLEELLKTVNRDIYPKDEYPYGQWSYQVFYEQNFEKATSWLESDIPGILRLLYSNGNPANLGKPGRMANNVKDGGWFGGPEKMPKPPSKDQIPAGSSTIDNLDDETVRELETAMECTGFFGADAYYMNHKANRAWILQNSVNRGVLEMPVLFIQAKYDTTSDTVNSQLADPMKKLCRNLTYTSIDTGHWVLTEKPEETNAAIARWLVQSLPECWPGYWSNGFVRSSKVN